MAGNTETTSYVLDNAADGERRRLRALELAYDATTQNHLSRLGLAPGRRMLQVGAGGGSLVRWLCEAVGPTGQVVATDVDPRFLGPLAEELNNLEVWQHNIVADPLPAETFDLAHARLVLGHLAERDQALATIVGALKPGGWLLVEDYDWGSYGPAYPSPGGESTIAAFTTFLREAGFEPRFGRRLPTILRRMGLQEVDAVGRVLTLRGVSSPLEPLYRQTFAQLIPRVLARGLLSDADVKGFFERFDDPDYDMLTQTMMSVWGRRAP